MRLNAADIEKTNKTPMNFVVGKGRSGTTLLQLMLNAHPNIVSPPESRFIILLYYKYGKTKVWTEKIISAFCTHLFNKYLFRHFWGVDKKELYSTLVSCKNMLTFPLACKIVFAMSAHGKEDVHVFFDKNPVYYYFLPELNSIFPDAKYIHLVRDYRANLLSHQRVFSVKNATDITYKWVKVNTLIEEAKSHAPQNFCTLTYESMVGAPQKSMQKVCTFLNLAYNNAMVENHQSGMYKDFSKNKEARFLQVHRQVFKPIDASLITSWQKKILPKEQAQAEAIAGEYAKQMYGYAYDKMHRQRSVSFITDLRYRAIKLLYHKVFSHLWLYTLIKSYLWPQF